MAKTDEGPAAEGKPRWNPAMAAAIVGGAAATAGALWGARAVAKRKSNAADKPLNSVMETAVTASEVSSGPAVHSVEEKEKRALPA